MHYLNQYLKYIQERYLHAPGCVNGQLEGCNRSLRPKATVKNITHNLKLFLSISIQPSISTFFNFRVLATGWVSFVSVGLTYNYAIKSIFYAFWSATQMKTSLYG